MAKRPVEKYDFKAFGEAIKAARTGRRESRKQVSDEMYISPRYLANIENKGQLPSLQIFFGVGQYQHSVDQSKLRARLVTVVESCVNKVGVNINTEYIRLLLSTIPNISHIVRR